MDLPGDEYFPGIDIGLTQTLIERAASDGFEPFVDQLVERAASFMAMNDDAFTSLEADVSNLQPVMPVVDVRQASANHSKRVAARAGNMQLAPAPSEAPVASQERTGNRSNVRTALSGTKVIRTSGSLARG
jgi:hypothetical protein